MNVKQAFLLGLQDRMAGLPMIARTPDEPELNDAYGAGYDPYNELGLILPEFIDQATTFTASLIRQCCPAGIPLKLPRNACEFSGLPS